MRQRRLLLIIGAILIAIALVILLIILLNKPADPIPANIKSQLSFKALYPAGSANIQAVPSNYSYQVSQKTLVIKATINGKDVVITEQPAPNNPQNNSLVYYESLGIHPVAQISSKAGVAVLANFYTTGNFRSQGRNAVFVKDGTLLIAHPISSDLTNEEWKSFFDNLVSSK